MKFLNIAKIAKKYNVRYVGTQYGCYNPELPKLGKKGIWIGVGNNNELVVSKAMLNCNNNFLDKLAADWANGRVNFAELA